MQQVKHYRTCYSCAALQPDSGLPGAHRVLCSTLGVLQDNLSFLQSMLGGTRMVLALLSLPGVVLD